MLKHNIMLDESRDKRVPCDLEWTGFAALFVLFVTNGIKLRKMAIHDPNPELFFPEIVRGYFKIIEIPY